MTLDDIRATYDFSRRTVVVTGGTGVLGTEMARALAGCNANVVLLARDVGRAEKLIATLARQGRHLALAADVLDRKALDEAARRVLEEYGRVDALVNGAGGNDPRATTNPQQRFFDIPAEAFQHVVSLNLLGTVIPSQAFGRVLAEQKEGVIVNVSSVNAAR